MLGAISVELTVLMRQAFSFVVCSGAVVLVALALTSTNAVSQGVTAKVSGGDEFCLGLSCDGRVRSWGRNNQGQLGLGHLNEQNTPQLIPWLQGVMAVAAGETHALALLTNGTVMAWGDNDHGKLGIGSTTDQTVPQLVPGLSGVTAVAAGGGHSLALLANGTVMAWGWAVFGQLGLGMGAAFEYTTPQAVPNLAGVAQLSAGQHHSIARDTTGAIRVFGRNNYGQLGLGMSSFVNAYDPQWIPGLYATSIATGSSTSMAWNASGQVVGWGLNPDGVLGTTAYSQSAGPALIPGLAGVSKLDCGYGHAFARLANAQLVSWGGNAYGQLGTGTFSGTSPTPQNVIGLAGGVASLAALDSSCVVLLDDGTVRTWGLNSHGQLGLGNYANQATAQTVPGLNLGAASYQLLISPVGSTALGITIPPNSQIMAIGAPCHYQNIFASHSLNATSPGTGPWFGLHASFFDVYAWMNLGVNGLSLAAGSLDAVGGATASIAVPPAALAGITIHGVSFATHAQSGFIVAVSPVVGHTF